MLYWDDWKDPRDDYHGKWGEHLAWEQWSSRHPDVAVETVEVNPLNQRIMIVMSANGVTAADTGFSLLEARRAAYRLASVPQDCDYERFLKLKNRLRKLPFSRLLRYLLRALAK